MCGSHACGNGLVLESEPYISSRKRTRRGESAPMSLDLGVQIQSGLVLYQNEASEVQDMFNTRA